MLILHFFKAGKPYHNTNGYQHNHHWMNGVAGPMSMQECLKLSAAMGGNILTHKYPNIETLEDFLAILDTPGFEKQPGGTLDEHVPELTGLPEEELAEAMEENFEEKPQLTADVLLGVSYDEFMNLGKAGVTQIADNLDIAIPSHSEQLSLLSDAKLEGDV